MRLSSSQLALISYVFSLVFLATLYGMWAWENQAFPSSLVKQSLVTWHSLLRDDDADLITATKDSRRTELKIDLDRMQPGLTLLTIKDTVLRAVVIEASGTVVQQWDIDWQTLWPDASHVPVAEIPKRRPGTHIHGATVMDNGDLVFNFEFLGMMRLDACNNVVWRLPRRTHHSIHVDAQGMIWASGMILHTEKLEDFPRYQPPFIEPTIVKVSPVGELLEEISVMQLLHDNGLNGVLYNEGAMQQTLADTLHLNDVETFDLDITGGAFSKGDVMISLRNMSVVAVFDNNWQLKHFASGYFTQQHDPDFVDENTISIFDNNPLGARPPNQRSRILLQRFDQNRPTVYFQGSAAEPFFTRMMGKQQWLNNGNVLIAESGNGRAFELSPDKEIVWEYLTPIPRKRALLLEQAERLPEAFDSEFFKANRARCEAQK